MAENDKNLPQMNMGKIKELENNVQDSLDKLYSDIHANTPEVSRTNDYLRARMHKAIDSLINYNNSNVGISNISSLYTRLNHLQNDSSTIRNIIKTFENDSTMNNVMSLYSQNVFLKELDKEYEVILKYMPKLHDALDTRKEAVLSADHFTKDALNITSSSSDLSEVNVEHNIKQMRTKYDIDTIIDRIYEETDTLGECYIYCVPYKKALERILDKDGKNITTADQDDLSESTFYCSLTESTIQTIEAKTSKNVEIIDEDIELEYHSSPSASFMKKHSGIQIEINRSGIINEVIETHNKVNTILNEASELSITEAFLEDKNMKAEFENNLSDENLKKSMYEVDKIAQDGMQLTNKKERESANIKVPGAIVKILDRTMIKPLYIENICLGYYYIETDKPLGVEQLTFSSTLGGLKPGNTARKLAEHRGDQDGVILKKIAKDLSDKIDAKFINANQDLTQEIYMILKYNMDHNGAGKISKIRVTFIPPEDIIHSYFNKDPKTHRGISALYRALFPAKLYSCLYISNVIAILTRSNDKSVYYVKQNVDTNIAGVLLNTINLIKKSNFGLRQIENMNNIMNITGRFNDYVIPESASGEAPVRFEIMQGQDVQHPTELMNQLEEMAVNSTDVPMEVIQARQQLDFATHYTMSNTRFLRKVYNIQSKFTKIINKFLTRLYDAEFECTDSVSVELPPPMYLALMNSSQMFQSANDHVENITPLYIDPNDQDQELVAKVKANIKKFYIKSFIPDATIQQIVDNTIMEHKRDQKPQQ